MLCTCPSVVTPPLLTVSGSGKVDPKRKKIRFELLTYITQPVRQGMRPPIMCTGETMYTIVSGFNYFATGLFDCELTKIFPVAPPTFCR